MIDRHLDLTAKTEGKQLPAARYVSSEQLDAVLNLLIELRELTQSRSVYALASKFIVELGGVDRVDCASFVVIDA